MIKNTLIVATCALALYSLFIILFPKKYVVPQGQQQLNVITAQRYIYNHDSMEYVIVGSSLAAKISKGVLPKNFYNLAFYGKTSCDGLDIIKKSGKKPKAILVEINTIYRKPSPQFSGDLFLQGIHGAKDYVPALQEEHEPVNTFSYLMSLPFVNRSRKLAIKLGSEDIKLDYKKILEDSASVKVIMTSQENKVSKELVSNRKKRESRLPDNKILQERLNTLKNYVDYFESRGIKAIFFEMPISEELAMTPMSIRIREKFSKTFNKNKYTYIKTPDRKMFITKDGSHLVDESAEFYTAYMLHEINKRNDSE